MKKILFSVMAIAIATFSLTSCEDIPMPYDIPGIAGGNGGSDTVIAPEGDGTQTSPYNVAAAVSFVSQLEADVESANEVYVKGKVKAITTTEETIKQYGNHTFTIVDEGNDKVVFTAFQVYGPGKKKFTSVDQIKEGDEVVVCGKVVNYRGNTPETVGKGASYVYSINGIVETETPSVAIEITCAKAVELCNALADGATSAEVYSITGYITDVFGNVSKGQQSFWMADTKDGGKVLQAYWANLPSGVSAFTKGSKVKITGSLLKYVKDGVVTTEIKNADVVILEEGGGDAPVVGDAVEISCAKAVELCNAMDDKAESTQIYAVTGYITETDGKISRDQQVFWMADTKDGGKVFEAYWANIPNPTTALPVGTKVKMTGKLMRYGTTAEMKNGDVVVLEMGDGGSTGGNTGGGSTGGEVAPGNGDVNMVMANVYSECTSGSVDAGTKTVGGITLSFAQNDGSNAPKYYWNATPAFCSVRMYAKNSVEIKADKTISKVVFTCAAGSGTTYYNGNPGMLTTKGTISKASDNVTVTVSDINSTSFTLTNEHTATSAGTQFRIVSMSIYYASSSAKKYVVRRRK